MKNIHKMKLEGFIILSLTFLFSCSPKNDKGLHIDAQVEGLLAGDTILFVQYSIPDWEEVMSDTLIILKDGSFSFNDMISQTSNIIVEHHPKYTQRLESCNRGCQLYARPGDQIQLTGNTEFFPALHKQGGLYNDPRLNRIIELEDSMTIERNKIYRKMIYYINLQNTDKAYSDSIMHYNRAYTNCRSQELKEITKVFRNTINDSEYAALEYLNRLSDVSFPEFKERFSRFTPEILASTTGKILARMLKVKENIEPGNMPPDFTVTDNNGNKVSLSDYRGKYLLIYHWGLCPGTIWLHPRLLELYKEYHNKGFEVIGFTKDDNLPEILKESPETQPLFDQPWHTVYTSQENNKFIKEEYYFNGVPILMVISPEGKTLYRGYNEIYQPLSDLLNEKLSKK